MTEKGEIEPASKRDANAVPLNKWARGICWTFGLSFGGSGAVAVFASGNQIGTGALLILSAIFSIIALTGRMPSKLKLGDHSVEWPQEIVDAVADAVKEGPPEIVERVAEAVAKSGQPKVNSAVFSRLNAELAELKILELIRSTAEELNNERVGPQGPKSKLVLIHPHPTRGWDMEITGKKRVGVEVVRNLTKIQQQRLMEMTRRDKDKLDRALVVITSPIRPEQEAHLRDLVDDMTLDILGLTETDDAKPTIAKYLDSLR